MGVAAWSKCPLASAPARLLCLLRARLAAPGSVALPGGEASPQGMQPLPRVLERAASKAADFTAFDHSGDNTTEYQRRVKLQVARTRQIFAN